jgi:hypothetical protein
MPQCASQRHIVQPSNMRWQDSPLPNVTINEHPQLLVSACTAEAYWKLIDGRNVHRPTAVSVTAEVIRDLRFSHRQMETVVTIPFSARTAAAACALQRYAVRPEPRCDRLQDKYAVHYSYADSAQLTQTRMKQLR